MTLIIIFLLLTTTAHAGINMSMSDKAMMSSSVPDFKTIPEAEKWAEEHKTEELTRRKVRDIVQGLADKGRAIAERNQKRMYEQKLTALEIQQVGDIMAQKEAYEHALKIFEKYKKDTRAGATVVSGSVPVKKER